MSRRLLLAAVAAVLCGIRGVVSMHGVEADEKHLLGQASRR